MKKDTTYYKSLSDSKHDYVNTHSEESDIVRDALEEIYRSKVKRETEIKEVQRTAKRFTIIILILALISLIVGIIKLLN